MCGYEEVNRTPLTGEKDIGEREERGEEEKRKREGK